MKKMIIALLLLIILSTGVLAWGATRTITGTKVSLAIDSTDGTGIFTIQEKLEGLIISSAPAACGLNGNILTCDIESQEIINYRVNGTGNISGTIVGGYPSTTEPITGDSVVVGQCTPACGTNICGDNGCGGSCGTCDNGNSCDQGKCVVSGDVCDAKHLTSCGSHQCLLFRGYWHDNACLETCPEGFTNNNTYRTCDKNILTEKCDKNHFSLCGRNECKSVRGYWHDNACLETCPEGFTADNNHEICVSEIPSGDEDDADAKGIFKSINAKLKSLKDKIHTEKGNNVEPTTLQKLTAIAKGIKEYFK